jgi:[ribosomal protein S5]-alanine N-acetyltransferase
MGRRDLLRPRRRRPAVDRPDQGVALHPAQGLDSRLRLRGRDRAAARGLLTADPSPAARPPATARELLVSGPSLSLRYPRLEDAPALFALAGDPEVTQFFSWGPYRRLEEASAWLATLPARRDAGEALELAVVDGSDAPIGITLLSELSRRDRRAVVGTWLGRAHWGKGANRETKALICALAFETLGLERLGAYADVRNARSQKALERLAFAREGVLRGFHRHGGQARDVALYSLLRSAWEGSELASVPARVEGAPPEAFAVLVLGAGDGAAHGLRAGVVDVG